VINVAWLVNSAHFIWGLDKEHKQSDSNMVFLVTKSYWPQYHYLLPWDYQSGEFGNYGEEAKPGQRVWGFVLIDFFLYIGSGCSTTFIRVFAALGIAKNLKTMTTEAVKKGLTLAVDSGRPVVECLKESGKEEMFNLPKEHYLRTERLQ
jgi:stearoyl-CoA desaturase (Delta-9 desaturase)